MARRYQISLRLVPLAGFMVALALAFLRLNIVVIHSMVLTVSALARLGDSIGWPIGFVEGRFRDAIVDGG